MYKAVESQRFVLTYYAESLYNVFFSRHRHHGYYLCNLITCKYKLISVNCILKHHSLLVC